MNSLEQFPAPEKSVREEGQEKENGKDIEDFQRETEVSSEAQIVRDKQREQEILEELLEDSQEDGGMKESEYIAEAKKVIENIDYKTLKSIFDEMRLRAGATGVSGFCGPERIAIDNGIGGGQYEMKKGIAIAPRFLSKREPEDISPVAFRNHIFSAAIHEETHASSKNSEDIPKGAKYLWMRMKSLFKRSSPYEVSGYDRRQFYKGSQERSFMDFNEGVTDKIAEEVYAEYLKRRGEKNIVSDQNHPAQYNVEAYLGSRAMVTGFIEIVAKSTGVPSETVWEAVKQGYMTGLDLRETELQEAFEEIFSEEFMDRMAKWGSGEYAGVHAEMLETVKSLELTEEAQEKVRLAFEKYQKAQEDKDLKHRRFYFNN